MSIDKNSKSYRVLVVDDLDYQRLAIIAAIREVVPSCEFVEAENVTAAENILEKEMIPFDLSVIDLRLEEPNKNGITLTSAVSS